MRRKAVLASVLLALAVLFVAGCHHEKQAGADMLPQLTGKTWVAELILGKPVIDMSHSSIEFREDGTAGGLGACNRYNGPYTLKDDVVTFGRMAATMKMCSEAVSGQEQRFFRMLEQPQTVRFENGLLKLVAPDGKLSRFSAQ